MQNIMQYAGLDESQPEVKIARRNSNLRYADDTTLVAESEEELKNLLIMLKKESEKLGLKLNIQKGNIMASGQITSWEIGGEKVETMDCKDIKKVNPKGNQPSIYIEGLMLKLKLQHFGHLRQRADSLEKILMLGKTEGKRGRGQQRMG